MTILANCATIGAILASAQGGETISLRNQDCAAITVTRAAPAPRQVTVNAGGSVIRGLTFRGGGNVRWRSGRIEAPAGAFGSGPLGYGVRVYAGAARVTFDSVLFTNAKKAIVIDQASDVMVTRSRFWRVGEDGIIASRVARLTVTYNRFEDTQGRPTTCTVDGVVTESVAQRDCRGTWRDGTHADAVQMRNGVTDALIANNMVRGDTQGLTQMDTAGDAPLERVVIRRNSIVTSQPHRITLGIRCVDCWIQNNEVRGVRPANGSRYFRAVIIPGAAMRCGNVAPDDRVVDRPC